jgi:hypothetical protein
MIFPSPAGMSLTLSRREQFNYSRPGRVWLVTSRLGTGKSINFFYSVLFSDLTAREALHAKIMELWQLQLKKKQERFFFKL